MEGKLSCSQIFRTHIQQHTIHVNKYQPRQYYNTDRPEHEIKSNTESLQREAKICISPKDQKSRKSNNDIICANSAQMLMTIQIGTISPMGGNSIPSHRG